MRSTRRFVAVALLVLGGMTVTTAPRPTLAAVSAHRLSGAAAHHLSASTTSARLGHHLSGARAHVRVQRVGARKKGLVASVPAAKIQMLSLINAERAQAGAGPLSFDPQLNSIAQWRSQDMIKRNYFSHQIPGGGMVFDVLDRDHVQYEMAGENIALNNYIDFYPMAQTVQQTNTDFMNSPEHRANILEPKYTKIGLGMAFQQSTGKLIVTEVFVQP